MRILVVSQIEWSDTNAFGNTVSNFFGGMQEEDLASFYMRQSLPDTSACSRFYRVTLKDCIVNAMFPQLIGEEFTYHADGRRKTGNGSKQSWEKKLINLMHKHHITIVKSFETFVFDQRQWDNDKFEVFVKSFNPQIVFFFVNNPDVASLVVEAVKRIVPTCKSVGFIADDVYGLARREKDRRCIESQIKKADKVYGISQLLCDEYQEVFSVPIEPLYKGCVFSEHTEHEEFSSRSKRIVYAGNLLYGRDETLAELAEAIRVHNMSSDIHFSLDIYTSTETSDVMSKRLNIPNVSKMHEAVPYEEVKRIMAQSEIVLHVESFDEQQKAIVRLSFSTKITDCLQSGSVILAVGPQDIASIEYVRSIPGALVIDNLETIDKSLDELSVSDLTCRAKEIHNYAIEKHDINKIRSKIEEDFERLVKLGTEEDGKACQAS